MESSAHIINTLFLIVVQLNNAQMQPFEVADALDQAPYDYSKPAESGSHALRVLRAVLVYFPADKYAEFELEFKWMYRSWVEMGRHEPARWRTDLVVFVDTDKAVVREKGFLLTQLNCSLYHRYFGDLGRVWLGAELKLWGLRIKELFFGLTSWS